MITIFSSQLSNANIWSSSSNSLYYCFLISWGYFVFKLQVIKGKVEEVALPEKADVLISEPMGKVFFFFFFMLC